MYSELASLPNTQLALVYGGATRIKGYLFEAPKLPEIRGASALLDWVNETRIPQLWQEVIGEDWASECIIYASGGNVLGFAPTKKAQELADKIEQSYTEHTLNANSFAVAQEFHLLEVRYGRLVFADQELRYWVDTFRDDWKDATKRETLATYYYTPQGLSADDSRDEALDARFFQRKTFGELMTVLAGRAMRRRDERSTDGQTRHVALYPLMPWAEKCDSSDVRPAVWQGQVGDDQRQMSEASARKRVVGQRMKRDARQDWFYKAFVEKRAEQDPQKPSWRPPVIESWETQWEERLTRELSDTPYRRACDQLGMRPEAINPPKDVDDIAAAGGGYIGMIYADGNNVGRRVARCQTPQDYQDLSRELDDASKHAVFRALSERLRPHNGVHPFEVLTIGGDDILLIVPGTAAFDIALDIAYHFEKALGVDPDGTNQRHDRYAGDDKQTARFHRYMPDIGLSAGVVIAQESAPIFFLYDLVTELLKNAKKAARERQPGGAVDFMVMKAITMVTDRIKSFRDAALGTSSSRRLTARPYTWHELAGLVATVRALKRESFPRSQLYRLRRVMEDEVAPSTIASTMEYLYTRVRLRTALQDVLRDHIEDRWQGTVGQPPDVAPWLTSKKPASSTTYRETIWADLIEMYDMVKEERDGTA
jgi:CRISPR-associated protein Cmr2